MEIVNIQPTDSPASTYQQYDSKDLSLITSATIANPFGEPEDYVEYFIYDPNDNLLTSNYYAKNYKPGNVDPVTGNYTSIQIDPESDVRLQGYDRGTTKISYNFFRNLFKTSPTATFWIKEISGDRTELRLSRQDLSNLELQQAFIDYDNQTAVKAYYPDFYLNFGENRLLIGVNVMYALKDEEGCLLIKLYEPLPDDLGVKDVLWIVEKLGDSATYEVSIEVPSEVITESNNLRGPNYSVDLLEKVGQATPLYNYNDLFLTTVTSSYQQLRSMMEEKGLDINVDYTDFSNFVHFSSATQRVYNFAYKAQLIENYRADIATLSTVSSNNNVITSGSKTILQAKIDDLIEKFDGYEYYLYFNSGSDAWPKSNVDQPYTLYSVTSSEVSNWLGAIDVEPTPTTHSIIYSASLYDTTNKDYLINTVPEYLTQDPVNEPYNIFLNMVGQHFDNIWIYLKDVTERYDAENNLEKGISRDLVGDALKGLGIKLYTNTNISDNIYYTRLGINPDGTLRPPVGADFIQYYIPFLANGLYVVTEYVDPDYVDSFDAGTTIPGDDVTKEYYKRLYHNVPYLLKTRGTERGLRALINCFGIPDSILRIKEFGGSDKSYSTPDLIQTRHSLAYYNSGSTNLTLPWWPQNYYYISASDATVMPDTIEFRFKTTGIPDASHVSQSLFEVTRAGSLLFGLQLTYDPLFAVPSSSYENYGSLSLHMKTVSTTPIQLPFFDTDKWWSVMIKRELGDRQAQSDTTPNTYWVYVKSATYNEEGDAVISFEASRSIYTISSNINNAWNGHIPGNIFCAYLGGTDNGGTLAPNGTRFQGYFQEFRYWGTPLSESIFNEHVINSTSYRSNTSTGSLYNLTFRLPLGSNLNIPYLAATSMSRLGEDTLNPFSTLPRKDYDLYELGATPVESGSVLSSYHPAVTGTFYLPFNGQTVHGIDSFIDGGTTFSYGQFGANNERFFQPFNVTDIIATPSTGISQAVNNKVEVFEKYDLEESTLSPHVSIQKPNLDLNRNSADVEVGFSPSDAINLDITNQLGYFNIDDYIGNPADAYEDTYVDLRALRTTYFQKYLRKFNVWDFIRLIKYYDNSLFKMMKDFVPARANLSTGIIVKPHILERPKYKRFDPIAQQTNNYSASINIGSITGSNPEDTYLDTAYTQSIMTKYGTVTRLRNDLREPFTGDFSGSKIQAVSGDFPQIEYSTATGFAITGYAVWDTGGSEKQVPIYTAVASSTTYSLDPLQNNVSQSRKSVQYLSTDYSYNVNVPVNEGVIEEALKYYPWSPANPFNRYTNQSIINPGDEIGYGLVAYVLQPGDSGYDPDLLQGFVVSTDNNGDPAPVAANVIWGLAENFAGATGTTYLDGKPNTILIYSNVSDAQAAKAVSRYGDDRNDPNWYLPSEDELKAIYDNFSRIREAKSYWTSTEVDTLYARQIDFSVGGGGAASSVLKEIPAKAYAIRYFAFGPPITTEYWPFAEVNDYNFIAYSRVNPRYQGSRLTSQTYTTYTPASRTWGGDISYGKTAVIDKIKLKYAYIVNVYTPNNQMPGRSNAQIKYLIDNNENTLNLTKVNNNLFDIQNIYKSGETVQISLFDYEPSNPDVQTLTNNKNLTLYEGGFRYSPVLVRVSGSNALNYTYLTPFFSSSQVLAPSSGQIYAPQANYWGSIIAGEDHTEDIIEPPINILYPYKIRTAAIGSPNTNTLLFPITCSAVYNTSGQLTYDTNYHTTADVNISITLDPLYSGRNTTNLPINFTVPSGSSPGYKTLITLPWPNSGWPVQGTSEAWYKILENFVTIGGGGRPPVTISTGLAIVQNQITAGGYTTLTDYYTSASDYQPDWYAEDTRTIRMSATQSLDTIYSLAVQTYSGSKQSPGPFMPPDEDIPTQANIDIPVFPIELNTNDMVKFFSPTSNTWAEEEEYRVVSTVLAQSGSSDIYYRYITLDRSLNPAIVDGTTIPGPISKYIALKHLPDETNLMLRYAPRAAVSQNGLIYPQYLDPIVRDNSGNVIQSLRANNLIDN